MKPIIIFTLAKNEHKYINDWIKYHISLGFDHIYIGDNDDLGSVSLEKTIESNLRNFCTILDFKGVNNLNFQTTTYYNFYKNYNALFDWCAFIDIDEYIQINTWKNIKAMVADSRFKNFNAIALIWHLFGDDGYLERDETIPVYKFFKQEKTKILENQVINKQFGHPKMLVRGGLKNLNFRHVHFLIQNSQVVLTCTPDGQNFFENEAYLLNADTNEFYWPHVRASIEVYNKNKDAWLNHYMTKTLKEFMDQKILRGDVQFKGRQLDLTYYWQLNPPKDEHRIFWNNYIKQNNLALPIISKEIFNNYLSYWKSEAKKDAPGFIAILDFLKKTEKKAPQPMKSDKFLYF